MMRLKRRGHPSVLPLSVVVESMLFCKNKEGKKKKKEKKSEVPCLEHLLLFKIGEILVGM